jgi:hypothetical protein
LHDPPTLRISPVPSRCRLTSGCRLTCGDAPPPSTRQRARGDADGGGPSAREVACSPKSDDVGTAPRGRFGLPPFKRPGVWWCSRASATVMVPQNPEVGGSGGPRHLFHRSQKDPAVPAKLIEGGVSKTTELKMRSGVCQERQSIRKFCVRANRPSFQRSPMTGVLEPSERSHAGLLLCGARSNSLCMLGVRCVCIIG